MYSIIEKVVLTNRLESNVYGFLTSFSRSTYFVLSEVILQVYNQTFY